MSLLTKFIDNFTFVLCERTDFNLATDYDDQIATLVSYISRCR